MKLSECNYFECEWDYVDVSLKCLYKFYNQHSRCSIKSSCLCIKIYIHSVYCWIVCLLLIHGDSNSVSKSSITELWLMTSQQTIISCIFHRRKCRCEKRKNAFQSIRSFQSCLSLRRCMVVLSTVWLFAPCVIELVFFPTVLNVRRK